MAGKGSDEQEIYDFLKNVNPESVVHFNNGILNGSVLRAFPTDATNGEMHAPPVTGHNPYRTVDGKKYYIPFEYEPCSQQRRSPLSIGWDYPDASWFTYGTGKGFEASKPFSAEFLFQHIKVAYDRGASSVLMACAPDYTGRFRTADVEQLVKLGHLLREARLVPASQ